MGTNGRSEKENYQLIIKIISIGPTEVKQGPKSSYSCFELTFKDGDRTKNKKIMSFNREIFGVLSNAQPGQHYEVTTEKKGEYWEWTAVSTVASPDAAEVSPGTAKAPAPEAPNKAVAASTYQGNKDASIARAVALKAAVDFLGREKGVMTPDTALKVANVFEGYLLNGYVPTSMADAIGQDTIESDPDFK